MVNFTPEEYDKNQDSLEIKGLSAKGNKQLPYRERNIYLIPCVVHCSI